MNAPASPQPQPQTGQQPAPGTPAPMSTDIYRHIEQHAAMVARAANSTQGSQP
ncbi:hypothetical protein ACIGZJ_31050 [Kitasatospora sp. NPDC052868]|uniref:hypothetical protein n=1 Tax=Kitasatospora sp. NPDC052868 TaxID=3364060 RepID=UPI0037C5DF1E